MNCESWLTLAPQELENIASRHVAEAIKLDSQGARPHPYCIIKGL